MKYLLYFIFVLVVISGKAQFSPAAGKPGSNALRYDSSCFVAWGTACKIQLGYMDVSMPDTGFANVGDSLSPTGPAMENGVLSLGDGGSATLSFANPIRNGIGWDFAVFENTFLDTFLELAFVEVSSDGKRYVRFPAISLTDTIKQTGPFGYTYPEKINNLAGKYVVGFGTPFDLEELKDSAGLDINSVQFVRITDVVGSMNPKYATRDSRDRKINDPWPTRFPSSGFDLDAIGVIHENLSAKSITYSLNPTIFIAPNPLDGKTINIRSMIQTTLTLSDISGRTIGSFNVQKGMNSFAMSIPTGMYYLRGMNLDMYRETIKIIVP